MQTIMYTMLLLFSTEEESSSANGTKYIHAMSSGFMKLSHKKLAG